MSPDPFVAAPRRQTQVLGETPVLFVVAGVLRCSTGC